MSSFSRFVVVGAVLILLCAGWLVLAAPAPVSAQTVSSSPDSPAAGVDAGGVTCRGALPPRLRPGANATVVDNRSNRVRKAPGVNAPLVGSIPSGMAMRIMDGPKCADSMWWWKVGSGDPPLEGWTSEGKASEGYYLVQEKVRKLCPGAYPSPLAVGDWVHVADDTPNRLRSQPRKGDNVVGSLPTGEPVEITNGPRCANGWVWWYVDSGDGSYKGWTSEGDHQSYWLAKPLY